MRDKKMIVFLMDMYYYMKHVLMGKKKREICPRCGRSPFVHGFFPNERFFCNHCGLWSPPPLDICPKCGGKLSEEDEYDLWIPGKSDLEGGVIPNGVVLEGNKGRRCKNCDMIW
jgi:ribosomal protein S27AE